jgi:chromosome segregation ATPase
VFCGPSQREKEKLHKEILDLEKKLDSKQALLLKIERYRGALEVMKHMGGDEDMDVKNQMDDIKEKLKEKEEDLEGIEELNQALIIKERRSNDELQDARKELIIVRMGFRSLFLYSHLLLFRLMP